jgi:hypothetical protein
MRNLIISFVIIVVLWQVSGLLGPSRQDQPGKTVMRLITPPPRTVDSPIDNGYFMLLGLTTLPGSNPVQSGYDLWLESNATHGQNGFDIEKPGRAELRIPVAPDDLLPEWFSPSPLTAFLDRQLHIRTSTSAYQTLRARYEQWLRMPFDDWGFAHRGTPRIEDLVGAHRLYVVDGFAQQSKIGMERLIADLARWRAVLRDARTIAMKVTAQVLLEDDLMLLSRIASEDSADRALITRTLEYLQPLTQSEYSLRWPMQSEFALAYVRSPVGDPFLMPDDRTSTAISALSRAAHLYPEDFHHVSFAHRRFFFDLPTSQRMWDAQASQYDTAIRTAETSARPRPVRVRSHRRNPSVIEGIAVPLEFDPAWEPFEQRLTETDARLRLVSLQVLMRKPTAIITVPTRLAEIGSRYFDPFTGFPMLWSPTQHKLYSVGKDGLDDGGDPLFDISVPLAGPLYLPNALPTTLRRANPS